jgi:LmbE family N-acetylglucosaminyl deacetylase
VISTHLDDAVLSAYSVLASETRVVTVLAAIPSPGRVALWDAAGGATDSHQRVLERRQEDHTALAVCGAEAVHLDFADEQYVAAQMLPAPASEEVQATLTRFVSDASEVYVPAGIGNAEHAFVRDAVLGVRPDATLYADLPYALRPAHGGFNPPRELDASSRFSVDVSLDARAVDSKLESVRAYASQLPQLVKDFGDFLNMDGLGRERFWRLGARPRGGLRRS